ncbi:sugar phosphate isomerase/epimerase family protein [Lacticaseibacillus absianus]|uniref:sugar phosphate isomerase/epimerase family protein n=1 Tax=Lacticaseibacillus absianus TaxID=2729623 RepID=UPI0015C70E84|nr:sugar phosphate isomerase/epimerase [Lacticaseibacillus absianus]
MAEFVLSAFADELSPELETQIQGLVNNGIHHIEVRGVDGINVSDLSLSQAQAVKVRLDAAGIRVSSIGSPIGKIGVTDDFDAHLIKFQHTLDVAQVMGSPYVRLFSFYPPKGMPAAQARPVVIARLQRMLAVAKAYPSITLLHENEKEIYGDTAERCLDLMQTLADPQLRVAFDPANFVQCGVDVWTAYVKLKPYIVYLHAKDALADTGTVTPVGQGDGDVAKVLAALAQDGFNGYLSIEPHLSAFPGFRQLERDPQSTSKTRDDQAVLFNIAADALITTLRQIGANWR